MNKRRIAKELVRLAKKLTADTQSIDRKVRRKIERLNEATDDKFKFSFGYIGNLSRHGDDRSWRLFHRNDVKSIAHYRGVPTEDLPELAKWILSLPEDEKSLVKELKMRGAVVSSKLSRELAAAPRIKWERSMFVPSQARGHENIQKAKVPKDVDVEIYTYEKDGKLFGIAFQGRSNKPLWHYRFINERDRDKRVNNTIENRATRIDEKKQRMEERKKFKHDYEVGDMLYSSWGYDQTNIDFYQVIGITDKSIVIREVASKIVRSNPPQDYMVPVKNKFTGSKMTKRVRPGGTVRIASYANAYKWDGEPKYQTSSGWGH